ncbi:MAG TPA: ribonuclease P protein component [Thermoanaerobacterales bacterium]|nr:ribonuclease P protein component [Thermoanaerobacterales bacterium]
MKKSLRLTKNYEFIKVYKTGRRLSSLFFTMYIKKNELNFSRLGVSVSKKVGKSVVRNKIKRRIKEIVRLNYDYIKQGYDIVVSAKPSSVQLDFKAMEKELIRLMKRGRIYSVKKVYNFNDNLL